jgi:hypothetical protein
MSDSLHDEEDRRPTARPAAYSAHEVPAYSEDPLITVHPSLKGFFLAVKFIAKATYEVNGHRNTWIVPCTPGIAIDIAYMIEPAFLRSEVVRSQLEVDRTGVWVEMNGATTPVAAGRLSDALVRDILQVFYDADLQRKRAVAAKTAKT